MRKLILLILTVVVIGHLGFVAYMSADRQATMARDEIARSAEMTAQPSFRPADGAAAEDELAVADEPEAPIDIDTEETIAPTAAVKRVRGETLSRRKSHAPELQKERRAARRVSIPAFPRRTNNPEVASSALTDSITIWYPGERKATPVREAEPASRVAAVPIKKEDRSFVDRVVMPIFKKPYGLIKAIGSKLR